MIGNWGGAGFDTGHPALAQMNAVKWAGKNFHTVEDVDPFIFIDDDGKRVANHDFGKARVSLGLCTTSPPFADLAVSYAR